MSKLDIMLTFPESTTKFNTPRSNCFRLKEQYICFFLLQSSGIYIFTLTVVLHTYLNFKSPLNPPEKEQGPDYKQIVLSPSPWSLLVRSSKSMTDTLLLLFGIEFPKAQDLYQWQNMGLLR